MKNYLVAISLLTTTLASVANTKQAIDDYKSPTMKIKVDQKKYLENIMENIKSSIKSGDRNSANNLTLWSKNYIQEFKKLQKEHPTNSEVSLNISNFEKFTQSSEAFLNSNIQEGALAIRMTNIESRISNLTNKISDAIDDFHSSKPYENKALLKTIVKEYDKTLREFALVTTEVYYMKNWSMQMQTKIQNSQHELRGNLKSKIVKYVGLILSAIDNNLSDIKEKLEKDVKDVTKTEMVNDLHEQYLNAREQINFLRAEKISSDFSYRINVIDNTLLTIKENFQASEKELINLWKTLFKNTKENLDEHIAKMETEGEWEKIEVLLESFKTNVKKFIVFKNKNSDLSLEYKEVNCLINEIRGMFLRTRYTGITKDEKHGTWSQWYLSESEWNAFRTGANATGMAIPPLAVTTEGVHRLVAHKLAKKVASATIETTTRSGTRTILNAFASKIYIGVWVGLAAGLGLFAAPSYSLNFIKTNGAGLWFKYNYAGYLTGMLAPSIEIHKTAKPQEMKYLNVWDVEEIKK